MNISFVNVDGPNVMGDNPLLAGIDLPLGMAGLRSYLERVPGLSQQVRSTGNSYAHGIAPEQAAKDILKTDPSIVAFGAFLWNKAATQRVIAAIKRARPSTRVVFGGPCVPLNDVGLLRFMAENPGVDVAVRGEGEETFRVMTESLCDGRSLDGVRGLAFREGSDVLLNAARDLMGSLEDLPSPLLTGNARIVASVAKGTLVVPLETSRGCPMSCSFCDFHRHQKKIRKFPLDRVRGEFEYIERLKFKGVLYMADPMLNADLGHFKIVLEACRRLDNLFFNLHGEIFDEESFNRLAEVRHLSMALGVQSVNPEAMRRIQRSLDLERVTRNVDRLTSMKNVDLTLDLIVGLPGDDYEGFKSTLDWALRFAPIPILSLNHLGVPEDSPLALTALAQGIPVDERGFAKQTPTFGAEDLMRASLLCRVLSYFQKSPARRQRLKEMLKASHQRPSEVLEAVVASALRCGQLKKEKIGAYSYVWDSSEQLRLEA